MEKGIPCMIGRKYYMANGMALAMGETEGFLKILADRRDGAIIGAHVMGAHASDLIHEAVISIRNRLKVSQLQDCIHVHPTLSETFLHAVRDMV